MDCFVVPPRKDAKRPSLRLQRYGFFLYETKQKSILFVFQPENDRNSIRNPYSFSILYSRLKLRHVFHHTNRFLITATANPSQYSNIGNTSVWFNDEIDIHYTSYSIFFSFGWIFYIVGNELMKPFITSWKLWHLFDNTINARTIFIFFWLKNIFHQCIRHWCHHIAFELERLLDTIIPNRIRGNNSIP